MRLFKNEQQVETAIAVLAGVVAWLLGMWIADTVSPAPPPKDHSAQVVALSQRVDALEADLRVIRAAADRAGVRPESDGGR